MLKNKNYNALLHVWLIVLTILIALIIVVGGLTRLTNSGLSITEWELFKGVIPPTSSDEWLKYFNSYKEIPQYLLLNSSMSLEEFKYIFLWEYAHRLLARFIGLFFLIPFLFFLYLNILKKYLIIRLTNIFALILIQGTVGWYMVKSGLIENTSVSHYRLSIHLIIAFSIFSCLLWIILNSYNKTKKKFFFIKNKYSSLQILLILLFIQIILGAFVSGLDAGKIYQTWPLMNGSYFPNDVNFNNFNNFFNFDNPSTAQFFHRNIAYLIFLLSIYLGITIFKNQEFNLYKPYLFYMGIITIQVILGIFVLVSGANFYLASMHQISSIFLILSIISLYHRVNPS